ncbi:MAG: luxQ 3, partial [Frankiales bacterium]|nr:luxQ 3 [Frankiales bacterium]
MTDERPWEALRRGLDDSPALVAIMTGPEHVFAYTNPAYDEFAGRPSLGHPVREVFPELEGQGFFELLDQVFTTGETVRLDDAPIRYVRPGTAEPVDAWLTFTYSAVVESGTSVTGVMCTAVDVTGTVLARAKADETAELAILLAGQAEVATGAASRLQAVTSDLTQTLGVDDVLETVLAAGLEALGATSGHVALVDATSGVLKVQDLRTTSRPLIDLIELDAAAPMPEVVRTGEPLFLGDRDEICAAFPSAEVRGNLDRSGEEALVVLPLTAGDVVLGVLRFGMDTTGSPSAPVRSFMVSLANHCAVALERAQLAASEQTARGQLQVSEERYRTLV